MTQQGLSYMRLESNIHEITIHDVQFPTIDRFFDQLDDILGSTPANETVRILIHVTQIPSVQYMISRDRALTKKYPQRFKSRIALVHGQTTSLSLLNIVGRALTHSSSLRLFPKDQVTEAMTWLTHA